MRVFFSSITIPERAAKRLKRLLTLPESKARQWTAYVLGYANWHELHGAIGKRPPSVTDEGLSKDDLLARLHAQVRRLCECLDDARMADEAGHLLMAWRPSAARPQEVAAGPGVGAINPGLVLMYLMQQVADDGVPLAQLLEEVLQGIQDCDQPPMLEVASGVATKALQSPDLSEKQAGRAVLEALSNYDLPRAWFNLAMAVMKGDGGLADEARGVDLLERVANNAKAPADYRSRARSLVGASLAKGMGGRQLDVEQALVELMRAAEEGDAEAGFNAGLLWQKKGVMASAAKYYRMGADGGHTHAMTNLGLVLLNEPQLSVYRMESVSLLREASTRGDVHALEMVNSLNERFLQALEARQPVDFGANSGAVPRG